MDRKLRVAVLGRTEMLLDAAKLARERGHEISFVATTAHAENYTATPKDFEQFAMDVGCPYFRGTKLHEPHVLKMIKSTSSDVVISMNWSVLLPGVVRSTFSKGVFNSHPGDLPRYRGNACPNWAILNGEEHVGLCIHEMVDELDAGDVAVRERFLLEPNTDVADVYSWLRRQIPISFNKLLDMIAADRLELSAQPKDPNLSLRCFPRKAADSQIDWAANSLDILRLIRASTHPFAGAYCHLEQTTLRIWRAEPFEMPGPFLAVPGQVLGDDNGKPLIATPDGALKLDNVTIDSTTDCAISEILSSLRNRLT